MQLGKVNVEQEILSALTAKQFLDWEIYSQLEPFDQKWMDLRIATIVQAIRNVLVTKEENLSQLDDCLLKTEPEQEPKLIVTEQEYLMEQARATRESGPSPKAPKSVEEQIAIARIMAMGQAALHRENSPDR